MMHTTVDFVDYESMYSGYEEQILLAPRTPRPSSRKAKAIQASATSKYIARNDHDEVEFNVLGTIFVIPPAPSVSTSNVTTSASSTTPPSTSGPESEALISISASENLAKEVSEKHLAPGKEAKEEKEAW